MTGTSLNIVGHHPLLKELMTNHASSLSRVEEGTDVMTFTKVTSIWLRKGVLRGGLGQINTRLGIWMMTVRF